MAGRGASSTLKRYGLHTVGALAALDKPVVCRLLGGRTGSVRRARARGMTRAP
ncbi:hypothetical protein ACFT0G_28445 [Streptomyces sp. NPDC057020]|uniref:hypothetical protein n=1 Tax=unclassified Streptomyces TaxID=2593676 RepID=UPI0036450726